MTAAVDRMAARLTVPFERGADRLALVLAPGDGHAHAAFKRYDFDEHAARFDADPSSLDPRYVLATTRDILVATTLTVGYDVTPDGGPTPAREAQLRLPAGMLAGTSALLDLGDDEGPAVRLRSLTMDPPPPDAVAAADHWAVTALLGNLAKLLWVMGWERDSLRAYMAQVRTRRRLGQAAGQTLDRIGSDLGVRRFPPLPYAFMDGAVALYHLEEDPAAQVQDAIALYGGAGHHSSKVTARAGAVGRFGRGFSFADPTAEIVIDDHPELGVDAVTSFTAECFVKPGNGAWEGTVLSKHPDPTDPSRPGWALSIGELGRGVPRNVGFLVSDGTNPVLLFADVTLATARFTHLAGVLDRAAREVRLYVDGTMLASDTLASGFQAPANAEPVRIGRAGPRLAAVFQGTVDEVLLSRAARDRFHPVLGEDDDGYRRRLRISQRWTLPTRDNLQAAVNDVAGEVHGVVEPLVVDDSTSAAASHLLRVLPAELGPDESIDDLGRRNAPEVDASGIAADDREFDPTLLVDGSDPRADFGPPPPPGAATPDRRRLRVGTLRALRMLLDLLQSQGVAGRLQIRDGFDPAAEDLRSVARAAHLAHPNVQPGRLAALAHQAGFAFVRHRGDQADVYVSVRSTETVGIELDPAGGGTATAENGFDLLTGQRIALRIAPTPPPAATVRWFLVLDGEGRASFTGSTDLPGVALNATHPGELTVKVQLTSGARSFTAARRVRVGIQQLAAGQSISAAGALGVDESVAAGADHPFDPSYLVSFSDPQVSFAAGANTRRMHPALAARLRALLRLLPGGQPVVTAAWDPAGTRTAMVGRAITVEQGSATVSLARLGALAHAAGFTYVASDGTRLRLLQAPGEPVTVSGPDQLEERSATTLEVRPRAAPRDAVLAGRDLWTANAGTDTVSVLDPLTGRVSGAVKVGVSPVAVAASPDGGRVYTADRDGNTVTALDTAGRAVAGTLDLGDAPVALAHHPAGSRLYVALEASRRVVEINTATLAVARSVDLGDRPVSLAAQPDGARLWVATSQSALRVIDTGPLTVRAAVPLAGPPADVVAGAGRVYATVPSQHTLQVLDAATATVRASFTDLGPSPERLALAPSGTVLYVTDATEGRIHLRQADGSAQEPLDLPGAAAAAGTPVAITADDHHAYVVNGGTGIDSISVLDAAAQAALIAVWPLGTGLGERLTWAVAWSGAAAGPAQAQLSGAATPAVRLTAPAAGPLLLRAAYTWPDHIPPYTFKLELHPQLRILERRGAQVVIRKDQYDRVLDVLNRLRPIGVEVNTRAVRAHVVEVRDHPPS